MNDAEYIRLPAVQLDREAMKDLADRARADLDDARASAHAARAAYESQIDTAPCAAETLTLLAKVRVAVKAVCDASAAYDAAKDAFINAKTRIAEPLAYNPAAKEMQPAPKEDEPFAHDRIISETICLNLPNEHNAEVTITKETEPLAYNPAEKEIQPAPEVDEPFAHDRVISEQERLQMTEELNELQSLVEITRKARRDARETFSETITSFEDVCDFLNDTIEEHSNAVAAAAYTSTAVACVESRKILTRSYDKTCKAFNSFKRINLSLVESLSILIAYTDELAKTRFSAKAALEKCHKAGIDPNTESSKPKDSS